LIAFSTTFESTFESGILGSQGVGGALSKASVFRYPRFAAMNANSFRSFAGNAAIDHAFATLPRTNAVPLGFTPSRAN
jgi:hypothetical protein